MAAIHRASSRACRTGAQKRFYVGRRVREGAEVYVVTVRDVCRLRGLGYRSGASFEWSSGAGAGALAFAILCHTTGRRPPDSMCELFCVEVVIALPHDGFMVGGDDIALWLAAERRAPSTWPAWSDGVIDNEQRPAVLRALGRLSGWR